MTTYTEEHLRAILADIEALEDNSSTASPGSFSAGFDQGWNLAISAAAKRLRERFPALAEDARRHAWDDLPAV